MNKIMTVNPELCDKIKRVLGSDIDEIIRNIMMVKSMARPVMKSTKEVEDKPNIVDVNIRDMIGEPTEDFIQQVTLKYSTIMEYLKFII